MPNVTPDSSVMIVCNVNRVVSMTRHVQKACSAKGYDALLPVVWTPTAAQRVRSAKLMAIAVFPEDARVAEIV